MKHKLLLKSLLLLCALIVGSGTSWGVTTTYQHIFSAKPGTSPVTLSGVTWTYTSNNLNGYNNGYAGVQVGQKSKNGSLVLTTQSNWGAETGTYKDKTVIKEVRLWLNQGTATPSVTVTIGGKSATSDGTSIAKNTSAGGDYENTTCVTYTPATNGNTGAVVISISTSSGAGYICCMEIDCEEPASNPKSTAPTIGGNAEFTISQDVTITAATGATIYYTMGANPSDPTTSSSVYSSAIHITGSTIIKAAAKEDGKDLSNVTTKSFTKNLADNAISVTGAGGTSPSVDRTGVSAVDDWTPSASATSGGTITYAVKSTQNLTQGTDFSFNTTTGKVTFITAYKGEIVITASVAADADYAAVSQDITLTVNGNKRDAVIAYDGEDAELSKNGTLEIDPDLIETDGTITIESEDEDVAIVSDNTITAVADGTTKITITTAEGTYYNAGSGEFNLTVVTPEDCNIALTGAPVAKTFDLYNNAHTQVINYTTSSTGAVSIAANAYATFAIDQENKTITITPKAKTPSAQTITVSQAASGKYLAGSTTFSLTVNNSATSETYEKVTNDNTLAAGDIILLVDESDVKAAGAFGSNTYMAAVGVEISTSTTPNSITITTESVEPLTLGGSSGAWTLALSNGNKLYTTAAKSLSASSTYASTWSIGISAGSASITNTTTSYGTIRYNTTSPRFLNYASETGRLPQIYRRAKYANTITVANGIAQNLDLGSTTSLTLSSTSYSGSVTYAYKSATGLTEGTNFTFNTSTGVLSVNENAPSGTITITASVAETATHKAASTDIVITVIGKSKSDVEFALENQTKLAGTTYTLENGVDFVTDGTVTLSSDNPNVATVNNTTLTITAVAVGTAKITVSCAEGTIYNEGEDDFTITVTAPAGQTTVSDIVLFNETFENTSGPYDEDSFSGSSSYSVTPDEDGWTFETANGGNKCAKFGSSNNEGSAQTRNLDVTSGTIYTLSFKCAPWGDGTAGVKVTVTGGEINDKTSVTTGDLTSGKWNAKEYSIVATASTMSIKFEKGGTDNRFFLDDVKMTAAPTATVTLNKEGYATYCSVNPIDFSSTEGYTAWRISDIASNGTITFIKITEKIKGGQGVLLYNKNADGVNTSNATITFAGGTTEFNTSENKLVGTTAPLYLTSVGQAYGLSGSTFKKNKAPGNIGANKAYIPVGAVSGVGISKFVFVDETTGITTIEEVSREVVEGIFDLQGRRLAQPQKGINIINGKKVVIK